MDDEIILEKRTPAFDLFLTREDEKEEVLAWLAIDLPETEINILNAALVDEIHTMLDFLETQKNIVGLIIYSVKNDNFILGADINMLNAFTCAKEGEEIALKGQHVFNRIENLPFHVVAAIRGGCLGGGLELALACHTRVAAEDKKTYLGLPEVKLGLLPGSGGTQRLPRLIGTLNALDLILSGRSLSAKEAQKIGLIDDAVASSILLSIAKKRALEAKPKRKKTLKNWLVSYNPLGRALIFKAARKKALLKTKGNYPAIETILEVMESSLKTNKEAGEALEAHHFGQLMMTKASLALRHVFFISNEAKKARGSEAEPRDIHSVCILGSGLMGSGIAYVSATKAKALVQIKDLSNDALLKALRYSYTILNKKSKRKKISIAELQKQMTSFSVTTEYQDLANCQLVIEAVFEDLALKHQMVKEIEEHFDGSCLFASNTSSLPIAQIASQATRPENIIGLHYFSPVEKMPLVEIIPHQKTSNETIATVVHFAKQQGKIPIVVADKAGFYVNRILAAYLNEAALLLLKGERITAIDNALVNFGFPLGPFALLDEVGIDICAKVSPILESELGKRFETPPLFKQMLEDNRLGRKVKKGFYRYKNKGKQEDKGVYALLGIKPQSDLVEQDIALRCFLLMLNECTRCLDEGVVHSARDGDIGAVFGLGFPPFLGGPFCYMDSFSLTGTVNLMKKFERRFGERFAPCDLLVKMMDENNQFYK